jgi:Na+/H+ antiporter NhaA
MAGTHTFLRGLRPSPIGVAGAAAFTDPSLLLELRRADAKQEPRRPRLPRGESGGTVLLVAAIVTALLWSNSPWRGSYDAFWNLGGLGTDLRTLVNEGLMTLFFLVVGLEAKRERDLGELREGRRLTVPVLAGLAGMALSAAVYVTVTAGHGSGGWGVAISTDTALALGALALTGNGRMRVFMLTLLVVDDVAALLVVSFVYPGPIHVAAVLAAVALLGLLLTLRTVAGRQFRATGTSTWFLTPLSMLTGAGLWLALFESGFDPVVSGLLIGLLTNAYEPAPAPSPNDRLQHQLHPLTSRVVVPLFALANAGFAIDGHLLAAAATAPITWGIILAYVVGKPLGIVLAARAAANRAPLSLSARELRGTALTAGVGFTVSLLIASRAFHGLALDEAKVGILATMVLSPLLALLASAVPAPMRTACPAR